MVLEQPKQIYGVLLSNSRKLLKETCSTPKGRADFIKHTQCLSSDTVQKMARNIDRFTLYLQVSHKKLILIFFLFELVQVQDQTLIKQIVNHLMISSFIISFDTHSMSLTMRPLINFYR